MRTLSGLPVMLLAAARLPAQYVTGALSRRTFPGDFGLGLHGMALHPPYGAGDPNPPVAAYARNGILARRLLERNVRFVQLFCGSRASGVEGLLHVTAGPRVDLKARGLLKDTLVLWATEFGRMPTQQAGTVGRDIAAVHEFYATFRHLPGLDHKKLTYSHSGIERRLTDVHGRVIHEILS